MAAKQYRLEEVAEHNTESDCWVIVHGKVYDVTAFLDEHPGGPEYLIDSSGGECGLERKSICVVCWRRFAHATRGRADTSIPAILAPHCSNELALPAPLPAADKDATEGCAGQLGAASPHVHACTPTSCTGLRTMGTRRPRETC